MAFISENIISEGNLSGNTLNVDIATITTQLVTPKISINGGLSADTITLTTTPTSNASATQILSRNSTTGVIEYRDYSTFAGTNVFNTLSANTITLTTTPVNNNSATQILSRNTSTGDIEYRDSSTFGGGSDNYVTGGTYSDGVLTLNRQNGFVTITGFTTGGTSTGIDTFVTGFTYSNNNLTISQNQGQPDLTVNISSMTGLTVNGGLSATTIYITTNPPLNNNNTEILTLNTTTNQIEYSDATSTSIYNYGVSFAMSTSNFLT